MITQNLIDIISQISKNIDSLYKDLNTSYREDVLARIAKLNEEVGELNSDTLDFLYKRERFSEDNLKGEFADVIICTLILANKMEIDINKALEYKLKIIKDRGIR